MPDLHRWELMRVRAAVGIRDLRTDEVLRMDIVLEYTDGFKPDDRAFFTAVLRFAAMKRGHAELRVEYTGQRQGIVDRVTYPVPARFDIRIGAIEPSDRPRVEIRVPG